MSSSIENENVVVEEVKVKRVKAKSFAQKDKKTLFSIMAFVKYLEEQGILPDDKTLECLEALPLYKTAAEKTAFFQQDMFDTKVVENELYKPMVSDYKKAKKEKKIPKKKTENVDKPKKERKPKEKKQKVEPEPAEPEKIVVAEEDKPKKERKPKETKKGNNDSEEPKRGRKPKQQIVELSQDVVLAEEKDPLDVLIQAMNDEKAPVVVVVPVAEEFSVDDVDAMMAELELEAEEIVEKQPVKEKKKVVVKSQQETEEAVVKVAIKKSKKTKDVVEKK